MLEIILWRTRLPHNHLMKQATILLHVGRENQKVRGLNQATHSFLDILGYHNLGGVCVSTVENFNDSTPTHPQFLQNGLSCSLV